MSKCTKTPSILTRKNIYIQITDGLMIMANAIHKGNANGLRMMSEKALLPILVFTPPVAFA